MKSNQKQIKTQSVEVRYSDGKKIVIKPYRSQDDKLHFGFSYYDKRGKVEAYEGSWTARRFIDWMIEVLEDDDLGTTITDSHQFLVEP